MGNGDAEKRTLIDTGRARAGTLVASALALLLAGCAGGGLGGGDGNVGPMGGGNSGDQGLFGSTMETTTVAPSAAASNAGGVPANTAAVTPGDQYDVSQFTCPPIQVRGGAAAWQVTDPQDGGIRYQATLGQFSRECRFTAPEMNMRVGIQGRVLLGAKGGPGRVNVPIRVAVVEEGPTPKSVWTKFYSVPVEIGTGVLQVDFGLVADDVNFPRPTPALSERYVVYVGFDPQGATTETRPQRPRPAQQPRPQAQRPRPAATPAATAPASAPEIRTAPVTAPAAAPTAPVTAPAATAPATSAPAPAASSGDTQWIGAPAPSTGGFSQ